MSNSTGIRGGRAWALATAALAAVWGGAITRGNTAYNVTSASDSGNTSTVGTLSWAIAQTNANNGGTIGIDLGGGYGTQILQNAGSPPSINNGVTFDDNVGLTIFGTLSGGGAVTWSGYGVLALAGNGTNLTGGVATTAADGGLTLGTGNSDTGTISGASGSVGITGTAGGAGLTAANGGALQISAGSTVNGGMGGLGNGAFAPLPTVGVGGAGGNGVMGSGFSLVNQGTVVGGFGGSGYGQAGGTGGAAGAGVSGSGFTVTNSGIILGGAGGPGTSPGSGAAAIVSTGKSTITTSGDVLGGQSNGGYAHAVDLSGGGNTLVLEAGYIFKGNVVSTSGTSNGDTLAFGGSVNDNFNLSSLVSSLPASYTGTQFVGFSALGKQGSSAWTLTGSASVGLTMTGGTVILGTGSGNTGSISGNPSLDGTIGVVAPNGGALQISTGSAVGGANGGDGISANGLSVTNNGSISGGYGSRLTSINGGTAIAGTGLTITNSGSINGGHGAETPFYGGIANGGAGISGSSLTIVNSGSIAGGNGQLTFTTAGNGGSGVVSTGNSVITTSGSIDGGLAAGRSDVYVDAVDLSGGGNQLVLESGYSFLGNVVSTSGNTNGGDTLVLGGDTDATFSVANVGTQFAGFANLVKDGASTWTLTDSSSAVLPITVNTGTLSVVGAVRATSLNVQNGASVALNVSGSIGSLSLATSSSNAGNIVVNSQTTLSGAGGLTNTGTVTAAGGGTVSLALNNQNVVNVTGSGTATFSGTVANAGTLDIANGAVALFTGTYSGAGGVTDTGTAQFDGTLSPGNLVTENFAGNVALQSANNLLLNIGGASAGSGYGQLVVAGSTTLGGKLTVDLTNGFNPAAGDNFQLISSPTFSGQFATLNLPALSPGLQWDTTLLDRYGMVSAIGLTPTFDVAVPTDTGATGALNTLSWALAQANSFSNSTINIALPNGATTIAQTSGSLPQITAPVTITDSGGVTVGGALTGGSAVTWSGGGVLTLAGNGTNLSGGVTTTAASGGLTLGTGASATARISGTTSGYALSAPNGGTIQISAGSAIAGAKGGDAGYTSQASPGGGGLFGAGFSVANNGTISGGNGGQAGVGGNGNVAVAGSNFSISNAGLIAGGNGGLGQLSGYTGGTGGAGISGSGMVIINTGSIQGGNGGATPSLAISPGGVGIVSTGNSTITTSGSIAGGSQNTSSGKIADAIDLSGGGNLLILQSGYGFQGNVVSTSGTTNGGDTLSLGGNANASFDVSGLGTQFVGFSSLVQQGSGTWTLTGTLSGANNSLPVTVSAGEMDVTGQFAATSLNVQGSAAAVVDGALNLSAASTNAGTLTINNGGMLNGSGTLTNTGTLAASNGSAIGLALLTNNNIVNVTGAGTAVFNGNVANAASLYIAGNASAIFNGTYSGAGSVTGGGTAVFGGTLSPGDPVIEHFAGNVMLQASNNLLMDIGGTTAGVGYDQLVISGDATLGGSLTIDLINGFNPASGDSFELINSPTFSGSFSSLNLPMLSSGLQWNTSDLNSGLLSVQSAATPEPATLLLLLPAGLMLLRRKRRPHAV